MKPGPFKYHRPSSVTEAVAMLASLDNAKVIAGGQSLVAMMNFRYAMPDHLVDLSALTELDGIANRDGCIEIGAMTRQRDLEFSVLIAEQAPLFKAALPHIGHRQTRNRGTIGGSLAHADPAAELPTVCLAYDAEIGITGPTASRSVAMRDFVEGFMTTALGADEILTTIRFAPWPAGHGYAFQEYARRHGDFAVVGVAVLLDRAVDGRIARASITLCGVSDRPVRREAAEALLVGASLDPAVVGRAAALAADIEAVEDVHATPIYRRHLARVLTARALEEAWARIGPVARVAA